MLPSFLFTGDGLLGTFARAGIRTRALAMYWQTTAMAQTGVTTDFHFALDVLADLSAQVTFNFDAGIDRGTKARDFLFGQVAYPSVAVDTGLIAQRL